MTICFIGHRAVADREKLLQKVRSAVNDVVKKGADTFLFGGRGVFNDLCLIAVKEVKRDYSHITRIYLRAEYQFINTEYEQYLLKDYDATYFSDRAKKAGRLSYVLRNQEMIDKSDICIFYYCESYQPILPQNSKLLSCKTKSGTRLALDYARKKKRDIIILN